MKLAKMRDEEGKDIINLGLGDPDVSPRDYQLTALVSDPAWLHLSEKEVLE